MVDQVRVWDNNDKEITGEVQPWDTWEKVKAVKGFPGGLIAFLQTSTDSEGCGFTEPTCVQAYAWPVLQSGKDLVGVAKTGSGKTLAFLLPGFIKLRKLKKSGDIDTSKGPGLLCMTPTRELCFQIFSDTEKFGKPVQLTAACAYGGEKKSNQEWKIKEGPDCLIATPGRLNDFCDSGTVNLDQVRFAVLDEADRMLDMGFEPQIKKVLDRVSWERQMCMFTATWPRECKQLASSYIKDPVQVQIGSNEITSNANIKQHAEVCPGDGDKKEALKRILRKLKEGGNCLVFSNTKKNCNNLAWEINEDKSLGLWTEQLHGDLDQGQRDKALDAFRKGSARVLVATDVAARGLDIRNIAIVVNYDCPKNAEDYVHRIGRTGRASDLGEAYTFFQSWGDEKAAGNVVRIMQQAGQDVPDELHKLAGTSGSGGGGGGASWDKKDDEWWKKDEKKDEPKKDDEWWKKDDKQEEKKSDEWWKKDEEWKKDEKKDEEKDEKKDEKKDEEWKKDDKKDDEWKKDEWKKDEWKKDEWKKDDEKEEEKKDEENKGDEKKDDEEDEEAGGEKRKALWDLLDEPAAKAAKTDGDDKE